MRPQPTKRPGDNAPLALSLVGDQRVRRAGHARAEPPHLAPRLPETAARGAGTSRLLGHGGQVGSTFSPGPAPRPHTPFRLGRAPGIPHAWTLDFRTWAEPLGLADCVFPAQAFQHPVPGAMEPRAVADALETGEEDAMTEALQSFNREVRGTRQRPRKFHGERKQRCARNGAGVCARAWQGARRWVAGWASGVSVAGQLFGRRGWALPYVQSDGCCLRGSSRPAALSAGPTCCM